MASAWRRESRLHPAAWSVILLTLVAALVLTTWAMFEGTFRSAVPVTLTSERAGLVMETGAKVTLRGVEVGRVAAIEGGQAPVKLKLDIDPDQIRFIPANVGGEIRGQLKVSG